MTSNPETRRNILMLNPEADALIRDRDRDTHASEDICCGWCFSLLSSPYFRSVSSFPIRQRLNADADTCLVLLTTLKYYSGIIFLTTNRCDDLDPAIVSRLDIHLEYPSLDFTTRLQLWNNLLSSPKPSDPGDSSNPDHSMTQEDFHDLAR